MNTVLWLRRIATKISRKLKASWECIGKIQSHEVHKHNSLLHDLVDHVGTTMVDPRSIPLYAFVHNYMAILFSINQIVARQGQENWLYCTLNVEAYKWLCLPRTLILVCMNMQLCSVFLTYWDLCLNCSARVLAQLDLV